MSTCRCGVSNAITHVCSETNLLRASLAVRDQHIDALESRALALQADLDAARGIVQRLCAAFDRRPTLKEILVSKDSRLMIDARAVRARALSPVPSPEPRESPETSGSVHVDNGEGWRRT